MILAFPHRGLARGRGTLTTDGRYVIPCAWLAWEFVR